MGQYVSKDAVVAEIESLLDKGRYHEEYDCAYRDGNNGALYALKGKINSLETKEVDLETEIERVRKHHYVNDDFDKVEIDGRTITNIAKHFFELGMLVNNPITAADRGMVDEIIINLKRVEKDYRINLTREMEWLRNKVKKGE